MVMVSALFYLQLISNYPGMINSLSAHFPMILAWFSLQHLVWKKTSNNELWFMRCGKLLNLHCIVVDYRAKVFYVRIFPDIVTLVFALLWNALATLQFMSYTGKVWKVLFYMLLSCIDFRLVSKRLPFRLVSEGLRHVKHASYFYCHKAECIVEAGT